MKYKLCSLLIFLILFAGLTTTLFAQSDTVAEPELALAESGPYAVALQTLTAVDPVRDNCEIPLTAWYPALEDQSGDVLLQPGSAMTKEPTPLLSDTRQPEVLMNFHVGEVVTVIDTTVQWAEVEYGDMTGFVLANHLINGPTEPDRADAPYPLILYSHWSTSDRWRDEVLFRHLASHGFVVVSIGHGCDSQPTCIVDRPMDILTVLDQLSQDTESQLAGMVDTDRAGVMGISYGGYTAIAAAGARVNPDQYISWATNFTPNGSGMGWYNYLKSVANRWDEVAAYHDQLGTTTQEGEAWASMTDERIRAIMPIVPSAGKLFGDRGLESVAVPTLMIGGTRDQFVSYEDELVFIYQQLTMPEQYLITFIDGGHHPEWLPEGERQYKHFSVAFFGYYLHGREAYAEYLTQEYVNGFNNLAWGVYEGN